MHKGIGRYLVLLALVTLSLTGCLRSAGDNLQAPEARALSTSTPQPSPIPTQEVPTAETIIITATIDPAMELTSQAVAMAAQQVEDLQNQLQPTSTPEASQFDVPTADTSFEAQQVPEVNDPLLLTATGIVAEATQRVLDLTATASGPVIELPTFTPTTDPNIIPPTATLGAGGPRMGVDCVHEVRQGENLYRLSLTYGVLVMDIARASGISNVELIYPGQSLIIPGCGTTGVFPPATPTPTPVATAIPVTGVDARPATGTTNVFPSATPFASAGGVQHTVSQGETLYQISIRYGVPMDAIAAANGITNPDLIDFNQVLTIP